MVKYRLGKAVSDSVKTIFKIILTVFFICLVPTQDVMGQIAIANNMQWNLQENVDLRQVLITVDLDEVPLDEAIVKLGQVGGVKINFNTEIIDKELRVSLDKDNVPLSDILNEILPDGIKYFTVRDIIVFQKHEPTRKEDELQEVVTGTVVDSETGEPLPGVNIVVDGTTMGTSTDANGNFQLELSNLQEVLSISYIGYDRQQVALEGQSELIIQMIPDIIASTEIVVVGFGQQERVSLTNSVAQVSGEDLARRTATDFRESLQGSAPGITVMDQGGRPGNKNVNIRIRGLTTLGNNNPLIIVDGIEQNINDVNPNDIESVSVLKDASSTAIYGSRAANGVILITTRRGEAGRVEVTYDGQFGIEDANNRPEHMDLENYLRLENLAHQNAGREPLYSEEEIQTYLANAPSPEYPLPFPFFERSSLGILELAPRHNHSIAVSGGSEIINTRASARYRTVDGILPNFGNDISEVRLNTDIYPTERLRTSVDLNYRKSNTIMPGRGESVPFQFMLHASKFSWPKYDDGTYGLGPQVNNPLLYTEATGRHNTREDYVTGSIRADYEILPELIIDAQYAIRYSHNRVKHYQNRYRNEDPVTGRVAQQTTNSLQEGRRNVTENTLNTTVAYSRDINLHGFTLLGGFTQIHNENDYVSGYRENFYNNSLRVLNAGSDENIQATGTFNEWSLQSYFGRLNYNYDNRYLLEVNARYDGSSRFSRENRFSFFPSASVGWRISQEEFWNGLDGLANQVNELKLRASIGETGNQAVGLYSYLEAFNSIGYSFYDQSVQGFAQTTLANQDLTWETTRQTNFGLDVGVWNDRLLLTFDYYNKVTEDILLSLPIPGLVGLGAPPQNAGVVQNKGYEIGAIFRGGEELLYSLNLSFSDNHNEVIDLFDTGPYITGGVTGPRTVNKEGLPMNSHWGYLTDGFFQSEDEVNNYPTLVPNTAPGDLKYIDLNDDGIINEDDHTFLGRSFPKYDFSLNANFGYRNWELSMQWQGAAGHYARLDGAFQQIATFETFTHAIYTDNFWTPENPNARFARPIKGDDRNLHTADDILIKSDYLRLKTLRVQYNLPPNVVDALSISNAQIYIGGTNLLTFSELNEWNLDPEIPSGRGQYYPQTSVYTIGLNLRF